MRVILYVRVSKPHQNTARQILDLRDFAEQQKWTIIEHPLAPDGVVSEHISGTKTERPGIKQVLTIAKSGLIDKVLVHEASRFGRRLGDSYNNIEKLCDAGVSLYDLSQHQETLDDQGSRTKYYNIVLPILLTIAAQEVEAHRERIISGIRAKRERNGGKVRNPDTVLDRPSPKKNAAVAAVRAIRQSDGYIPGAALRTLSKNLKVSLQTMYNAKKALIASGQ